MFKRALTLIGKTIIALIVIVSCFLLILVDFAGSSEETRKVEDLVISEDASHKVVVTKIGNSYGYQKTVEFALYDNEERLNAVFVENIYASTQEEGYAIDLGKDQVTISVNNYPDLTKGYRIVLDYNDLAGRDVSIKDYYKLLCPVRIAIVGLFAVSIILLIFSKERKGLFGFVSVVLAIVYLFIAFGFSTSEYDLSFNNIVSEDSATDNQQLWFKNKNYGLFQDRLNEVVISYNSESAEYGNINITTYASGKIDNTKIDVVFYEQDSLSVAFEGDDSFAFTLIRE